MFGQGRKQDQEPLLVSPGARHANLVRELGHPRHALDRQLVVRVIDEVAVPRPRRCWPLISEVVGQVAGFVKSAMDAVAAVFKAVMPVITKVVFRVKNPGQIRARIGGIGDGRGVLHAIYDRITVAGRKIVSVRLTQSAYAHGFALALPTKVALARPTGVERGDATIIRIPVERAGGALISRESA